MLRNVHVKKILSLVTLVALTLCTVLSQSAMVVSAMNYVTIVSENFDKNCTDGSLTGTADPVVYDSLVYHGSTGRSLKDYQSANYNIYAKWFIPTAGKLYSSKVWVKTQSIAAEGYAKLAIECFDSNGNWISGGYSDAGVGGTSDWTLLQSSGFIMPQNAVRACVSMYITNGKTGTAWFDDLEIMEMKDDIIRTVLAKPAYRGIIYGNATGDIEIYADLNKDEYDVSNMKIVFEMINSSNQTIASQESTDVYNRVTKYFNSSALSEGDYTLKVSAVDRTTLEVKGTSEWLVKKVTSQGDMPSVYTDKYRRVIVNGQPFFPIGYYLDTISTGDIDTLTEGNIFNTALPYNSDLSITTSLLDYANSKGLKIIYNLKDYYYGTTYCPSTITSIADEVPAIINKVNQWKSHPAILAWYINDEISVFDGGARIKAHNDAIRQTDYNHGTFSVDYRPEQVKYQLQLTDMFGTDPYPVYGQSTDNYAQVTEWANATVNNFVNRSVWQVVQAHNLKNYDFYTGALRAPNTEELRNMAWQDICAGANGLMFYSWFDIQNDASNESFTTLWERSKTVAGEVKAYVPMLLSVDEVPAVTVAGGGSWLGWRVNNYNGKTYIFSVNNTSSASNSASFIFPGATLVRNLTSGANVNVVNGTFTVNYAPLGVNIFEITTNSPSPNLLSNPDFETGNLTGWIKSGSPTVETKAAQSGSYGANLSYSTRPQTRIKTISQTIPVTAGNSYSFKAMLKSITGTGYMEVLNGSTVIASLSNSSTTWSEKSLNVTAPSGATLLTFRLKVNQAGMYADNVVVQ